MCADSLPTGGGRGSVRSDPTVRIWKTCLTDGAERWKVAAGDDVDRADALLVRYRVYCEELGYRWDTAEDSFDARADICAIRARDGAAIASLRILGPEARPFEVERFARIDHLAPQQSRLAEISRFCVLPPFRHISSFVHFAAFQFAFDLARLERFSHFIVWVKPSLEPIYRYLLFEAVEDAREFQHPDLGNALHRILLLNLNGLAERYGKSRHPLAKLLDREPSQRS